jgi:hypothetical protein
MPEGWRIIAFRLPLPGEHFFSSDRGKICPVHMHHHTPKLIVERITPLRMVLEDTGLSLGIGENRQSEGFAVLDVRMIGVVPMETWRVWREVKKEEV